MSGGTFSKESRPFGPGTYVDFIVSGDTPPQPAVGHIVALGVTSDWGPFKVPTEVFSIADFLDKFKVDTVAPTSAYYAVRQAFVGEGTPEFGGAGSVIVYRMGGSSAAKASKSLQNTTPATAVTLTAKFEGTLGNSLKVTAQDHASDATKNELVLLRGSTVLETYVYADTNITDLVAQVNAQSQWVTATLAVTGVALAPVSGVSFTAGDSGSTLLAGDYTAAMDALALEQFGVLAFENLTDGAILASLKTWVQQQNAAGRRFFLYVGGAADETITTANSRSLSLNDENIVNVGVGHVLDDLMLDANGQPVSLSSAQLAPRLAGIRANRGERYSDVYAKLIGVRLFNPTAIADYRSASDNGTAILGRGNDGVVRVELGNTTYSTTTDPNKPKKVFGEPRYVSVMHGIQHDLSDYGDQVIIGKTTVDDDTRSTVIAHAQELLAAREAAKSVRPGWTVVTDPVPPPSDNDEFVAFQIGILFGRSTKQVFFSVRAG